MSPDLLASSPESRTTLDLAPIVCACDLRGHDLAVLLMHGRAGVFSALYSAGEVQVFPFANFSPTGEKTWMGPQDPYSQLLAWRTAEGPWTVIDKRVSAMLNRIDSEIDP